MHAIAISHASDDHAAVGTKSPIVSLPQPPQYPHRIIAHEVKPDIVNSLPKSVLTICVLVQNGSFTTCRPRFRTCGLQPLA